MPRLSSLAPGDRRRLTARLIPLLCDLPGPCDSLSALISAVTRLLPDRADDAYALLSALCSQPESALRRLPGEQAAALLRDCWDEELADLMHLCARYRPEELLAVLPEDPCPAPVLEARALAARRQHELTVYLGQMLWLVSAQLHAMQHADAFTVPDVSSLTAASDPSAGLLSRLKGGSHDACP